MSQHLKDGASPMLSPGMTVLADAAERPVVAHITKFFSKERLQREAIHEERARLARDLHDGVLQSLAGIALQLEAASRLIATEPAVARERLFAVSELIAAEKAELRTFIRRLKPIAATALPAESELAAVLQKLRERIERQSSLHLAISVEGPAGVPRTLGDEVYRIVQEALSNIVRHAHAQEARVDVSISSTRALIKVSDDGVGFPFRGKFELTELKARSLGPMSIRERVASLRGELVLTSSLSGSTLEIELPVGRQAFGGAPRSADMRRG